MPLGLFAQASHPGENGDVADGVVAAHYEVAPGQPALQHAEQADRLGAVALLRVRVSALVCGVNEEVLVLAEHGSDMANLEKDPLDAFIALDGVCGQELAGLLRQIDQDGARFHDRNQLSTWSLRVDDGRDLRVGVDRFELGRVLIALEDVDQMGVVVEPEFLQRHGNLDAVGRVDRVKLDPVRMLWRPALVDQWFAHLPCSTKTDRPLLKALINVIVGLCQANLTNVRFC